MNGHWPGRSVVVTGAVRGQGAALAAMLAGAGATVHAIDRLPAGDGAWSALRAACGTRLIEWRHDVADPAGWDLVAQAVREGGTPLGGLVNNAGITGPRHTVTHTVLTDWQQVLDVNLTGAMLGIRALAPLMGPGGAIVNVSSTVGMTGYYSAAYSTSKWALRGLTRSAALELAPRGVRVNCICPGVVDTEMIHNSPALVAALQHVIPMQKMAVPAQIAEVVMFLLSPSSAYVTGADIAVDGGVTGGGIYWPVGRATGALDIPTTTV
jgi:3alpha(or 20beta)-hydroxysteroid dehydrogenase